jgi:hypothetical protein
MQVDVLHLKYELCQVYGLVCTIVDDSEGGPDLPSENEPPEVVHSQQGKFLGAHQVTASLHFDLLTIKINAKLVLASGLVFNFYIKILENSIK